MKSAATRWFLSFISLLIMTYNTTKNISHWTEKHTQFSLKNGIKNVASYLWKWILSLGKEGHEIEFNLKEFQKYVAKLQGKPFTFWYVREKLQDLASLRIIHIDKDFGSNWYRIHLRHPAAIEPKKAVEKKLTKPLNICDLQHSNASNSDGRLYSSSNSSIDDVKEVSRKYEILKLCGQHGIYFDCTKVTTEVLFDYELEDIKSALNHFNKRGGHRKIRDSKAWLIDCLANCYWIDNSFGVDEFLSAMTTMFSNIPVP